MKTRLAALMAGIILLLGPAFASAATFEWVGYDWSVEGTLEQYTPTEDWNDPLAWYSPDGGSGVPGPSDTAIIGNFDIDGYGVVDNIVQLTSDVAVGNLILTNTDTVNGVVNLQTHTINLYGKLIGPFNIYYGTVNGVSTNAALSGGIVVGYQGQISGTLNVATNDTVDLQIAEAGSSSLTLNNYGTLAILPYAGVTDVNFPFLTLNNYGALSLQSIVNMNLFGLTLTNYGTVDWISSTISGGGYSGAFIYNYGLWDCQGDLIFNGNGGTYFYNKGTFRKSSGINTTALNSVSFYSSGTVDVESGTVTLNNGGSFSGGAVTGSGGLLLCNNGGSAPYYNINNTLMTTNVQLAGGHLDGNNTLMGGFTWSSGNLDNVGVIGTVTVATNTLLVMNSGGNQITSSGILTNAGTMQLTGGTTLSLNGYPPDGTLVNLPGGTVDVQENGTLSIGTGYEYINNQGKFLKSAGGGTFNILPPFYSSGTVDVESGNVTLNYGGTFTGGAVTGPGGLLLTTGNGGTVNYSFNNTLTTTNVQLAGGTLDGNNTLMGGFTWSSGYFDSVSTVTVATNTLLVLAGASQHNAQAIVTNYGTVEWTSPTISGGGYYGTFIYNYGLWDSQGDWTFNGNGGSGTYFYNIGTFRKSSGINTTALNSVAFYNSGAVEIDSGTLSVPNSITVAAGGLTIGISGTNSGQYGQLVSGGVATLNGPLNVFLANGYKSFAPDQFTILSAASDSGSFSSVSLPSGLSVNYAGAYAWLQSTNMQVIPQLSDTNLQFSFYTFAGQSYTIQTTTNLAGGIWNFYQNTTGNNDFQTFTLPITNTVPELFLRVSQP